VPREGPGQGQSRILPDEGRKLEVEELLNNQNLSTSRRSGRGGKRVLRISAREYVCIRDELLGAKHLVAGTA
jgi:hypothetical protein